MRCYCHSECLYHTCCEPYLKGVSQPNRAVQLMRSRYTAFCLSQIDYLQQTSIQDMIIDHSVDWVKLTIIKTQNGAPSDSVGTVEFKAFYMENQALFVLHEESEFIKRKGVWVYASGDSTITPIGH